MTNTSNDNRSWGQQLQDRWAAQAAEEVPETPYEHRRRREAEARERARYEADWAGRHQAWRVVRREAFKAVREGRHPNVILFHSDRARFYADAIKP
jgi:hypothetical protein